MTQGYVIRGASAKFYSFKSFLRGQSRLYAKMAEIIRLGPGQKLLDVGCGTGELLFRLAKKYGEGVELHGIDPSEDMIKIARKRAKRGGPFVSFQIGEGESLPFADESFDWVVSSLAMHHMPLPGKKQALSEIHRVLRPGGWALITDWCEPRGILGKALTYLNRNHAYIHDNLAGFLSVGIAEAGLHIVSTTIQFGIYHHILAKRDIF